MNKMNILKISTLCLCVGMGLGSCGSKSEPVSDVKTVNVSVVHDASELPPVSFPGKTKASTESNVSFRVSGQLLNVCVKEGDRVSAGQVVATMDPRDYEVQLTAATAEYNQIKADAERVMALYKEGNTTAQNYDKARYGLEQITQKLKHCKDQVEDTKLKSPISGYVRTVFRNSGETVAAGMPIVQVSNTGNLEVEIHLPASEYVTMDKYLKYYCTFNTTGDEIYPLSVCRIDHEANSTQLYTVRLRFTEPIDPKQITAGMTTMVYAAQSSDETGLVTVPSSSIIAKGAARSVMILAGDGKTVRNIAVSVLTVNNDGTCTVQGEGLHRGAKVVSTGARFLKEGQQVEVLPEASKSNIGGLL